MATDLTTSKEMKNTQELSVVAKVWNIRKTDFGNIWPSVLTKEIKF